MRTYRSLVVLAAKPGQVREALLHPEAWLRSWRHVRALELLQPGGADGVGRRYRTTVRAVVPYELTWEMTLAAAAATTLVWDAVGDLRGRAEITLDGTGGHTEVTTRWSVTPTPRWMRRLWPVASRVFVRNHDAVMRRGARRLANHLDVALLRCDVRQG